MCDLNSLLNDAEVLEIICNCKGIQDQSEVTVLEWGTSTLGGEITGFLGEHLKLSIDAKIHETIIHENFFIKTLPFRAKDRRFVEEIGVLKKEVHLYLNVLNEMPKNCMHWHPTCYYGRDDILILEDLSLKNYQLLPSHIEFNSDHIKSILKSLATMHACSLNFQNMVKKPLNEIYDDILFEVTVARRNNWFRAGLRAIEEVALKRTKYTQNEEYCKLIKKNLFNAMNIVFDMVDNDLIPFDFICVLSHRDLWRNNLMFKFDKHQNGEIDFNSPLETVLIDFQIARYLPPAVDILMVLFLLQRNDERKNRYQDHLNFYYTCLKDALAQFSLDVESIFPYEELWRTCEHFQLLGAVLKGVFLPMTHLPHGVIDEIHKDADKYRKFIAVDRSDVILQYIDNDKNFQNWMIEAVEEIVEMTLMIK
uniref:CSON000987 protein n=1 Tax=Culicoides sonorensis TaxID=179676 RepID=A0A336K648_CULSO